MKFFRLPANPTATTRQSDKVIRYERLQRRRKAAQVTKDVTTGRSDENQPDIQLSNHPDV